MFKKFQLISFFCTAFIFFLNAQIPFFKKYELEETYRDSKTELIFEAKNSLLWFGTSEGLFSFDGLDFKPFFKNDTTSNHVRAIFEDSKGIMWVGYQDGTIYCLTQKKLTAWQPEEGTPSVPITGFSEDKQGRFWIATYGEGIYYKEDRHLYNINMDDGLLGDDIYVLRMDKTGRIWLGTDGGISICHIENKAKKVRNLTREDGLPDDIVREIIEDKDGNFWIGMYDKGVCYFDTKKQRFEYPIEHWDKGIVSHLEIFEGRELWIGTEGNGIWLLSLLDGNLKQLTVDGKLSNAKIYDLHKDIEGNIWIVSNAHGICRANRQFELLTTDFENIQAMVTDSRNTLWIGTQKGLFSHHSDSLGNSFFTPFLMDLNLNVISLFEDKFQNLWIGTFGQGVYIFNQKSKKIRHLHENNVLTNGSILSIAGVNGHVWLATLGGVMEIDLTRDVLEMSPIALRNFDQEDGLGTNFIYKAYVDSRQRTWFATDGKGISVLENGQIKNFQTAVSPNSNGRMDTIELKTVYSLTEDHQGHIWLSTAKEGIFEFDGQHFQHLTFKEGIRDSEITSLITDEKGNILIVHPTGIDILDPKTHHLIYYDDEVGIADIQPNLNAVCANQLGQIWIGGKNKIIKYIALNETLEIHPRTYLQTVSVFLEPVDYQEHAIFTHSQNNLVFDYLGLWYTDPQTVKYKYRLEGYNADWIETKDRKITYSNLPPGSYKFAVTSTENEAWLDEPIAQYSFEILAPFWQRWWFILICILLASGLFLWFQKARDKRLQRVNLLEKEKVESQLEALKSQINPHFLFNSFNTLATIIEENPKIAVEYVEHLSDFYRSILQYRNKEIISLQEEIELVNNYHFLLEKRFGENFKLNIQNVNGQPVFVVPLALQMLVENAVKHNVISKFKPLTVTIDLNEKEGVISVSNNLQHKLQPEKSTHFGLQSLEKRYQLLSGQKIKILENEQYFRVELPIISN